MTAGGERCLIRQLRPSTEGTRETERRLSEARAVIARFGRENARLAALHESLASRRALVDSDYSSARLPPAVILVACLLPLSMHALSRQATWSAMALFQGQTSAVHNYVAFKT